MPFTAENWELLVALDPEPCWLWKGRLHRGYGKHYFQGKHWIAHRLVYEVFVGPLADDVELDHVCHTADTSCLGGPTCVHRRCVNPAHLEPVTKSENSHLAAKAMRGSSAPARNSRKTHCPKGHEYTAENTLLRGGRFPGRICRTCHREWNRTHPKPRKSYEPRKCVVCDTVFTPKRSDRILCGSTQCKGAYRRRK